ncbi:MAG: hypothetical protein QOG41_1244 [Thermoleophilaceae bacterium]|nr:hypothetical protein [Thermoleophilaceae bacterium]
MTTSSDRVLLRWLPLAVLLAAVAVVLLTVIPHPFGYHRWPQPIASSPPAQVVRVAPDSVAMATASRGVDAAPRRVPVVAEARRAAPVRNAVARTRTGLRGPGASAPATSRHGHGAGRSGGDSRGHRGDSRGSSGRGPGSDSGPKSGASPGTPLAQVNHILPPAAQARPEPTPVHAPKPTVAIDRRPERDRPDCGGGHGRGRARGHSRPHGRGHGAGAERDTD